MSTRDAPPAGTVLLTCGDAASWPFPTKGAVACAAVPARAEVDPLLDEVARLVVAGTDAALAAVLVRLLRRERLDLAVGFVPAPSSDAAGVWGLPVDPAAALELAVHGTPTAAPLIRDDRGGVIAGVHRVAAFSGVAYCDEHELVRGTAAGLAVRPDPAADTRTGLGPGGGGVATSLLERRRFRRARAHTTFGRAATVGVRQGTSAAAERDGVPDPRPLERRSWYRHTADWHLVRG